MIENAEFDVRFAQKISSAHARGNPPPYLLQTLKEWIKKPKIQTKNAPTITAKLMPRQVKSIEKSMEKSSKIVKNRVSGGLGGSGRGSWGPSWLQDRFLWILCATGLPTWVLVGGQDFDFMLKNVLRGFGKGAGGDF